MPPRLPVNRGLPKRWKFVHGAWYYRPAPGTEGAWDGKKFFRLGTTLPEAYKLWAERLETAGKVRTVAELLDRYLLQVVPNKAPKTQDENRRAIVNLRKRFGPAALTEIEPHHIYEYIDKRGAKVAAQREIEVLSHAFTKAVEWGLLKKHPFKGEVRIEGNAPRTRYVEDWEVIEALALVPKRKAGSVLMTQAYIRLKLLTGLARSDLLRLRLDEHLRDDGIHVARHKTLHRGVGKVTIYDYELVPERLVAVEAAKRVRPALSPFLFCNKRGEGYFDEDRGTCSGFDSLWRRFMDRVMKETKVKVRFTEHDLRAKAGSDAESIEKARKLLQHATAQTTVIYRRKPERV